MGLLREPELKKILKETIEEMVGSMRSAVADAVRANMPPMPQTNTHQIARLTVVIEGLRRDVESLIGKANDNNKPASSAEIRKLAEDEKARRGAAEPEPQSPAEIPPAISPEEAAKLPTGEPDNITPAIVPTVTKKKVVRAKKKTVPSEPVVS